MNQLNLDLIDAFAGSVFDEPLIKHGSHDQKTHGSWATGELHEGSGYKDSDAHPKYDYDSDEGTYIEAYCGPYSDDVNNFLRTGKTLEPETDFISAEAEYNSIPRLDKDEVLDYVDAMDKVIAQSSTPREMALYRGIGGDGYSKFAGLKVGDEYTDKGFVSTTPNPEQLWEFMPANNRGAKGAVLEITVPKGTPALSIKKYFKGVSESYAPSQAIQDENEHILARGLKFRVTGIGETRVSANSQREGNPADLLIQVEVIG